MLDKYIDEVVLILASLGALSVFYLTGLTFLLKVQNEATSAVDPWHRIAGEHLVAMI
jgi:hypothetical protein